MHMRNFIRTNVNAMFVKAVFSWTVIPRVPSGCISNALLFLKVAQKRNLESSWSLKIKQSENPSCKNVY